MTHTLRRSRNGGVVDALSARKPGRCGRRDIQAGAADLSYYPVSIGSSKGEKGPGAKVTTVRTLQLEDRQCFLTILQQLIGVL